MGSMLPDKKFGALSIHARHIVEGKHVSRCTSLRFKNSGAFENIILDHSAGRLGSNRKSVIELTRAISPISRKVAV